MTFIPQRIPAKNINFALGGGLAKGRINMICGARRSGKSLMFALNQAKDHCRNGFGGWFGYSKIDHRLTLEKLKGGYDPIASIADKILTILHLYVDEHIKRYLMDPRKGEIVRLTKLLIAGRRPTSGGEHRSGILSVFDTGMGITVRLFKPENKTRTPAHDLVYSTTTGYSYKRDYNIDAAPFVEGTWDPYFADETLQLLRRATVLDELANV